MYLKILFICGFTTTNIIALDQSTVELPDFDLKWSSYYSVKVIKITLTSGLTETIEEWHIPRQSRQDYNGGTVKLYYKRGKFFVPRNRYEIYPRTTEEVTNEIVCNKIQNSLPLESILPPTYDMNCTGQEIMNNMETYVFYWQSLEGGKDFRRTLWASFVNSTNEWIPVKYEEITYCTWVGNLCDHIVWEFNDYVPAHVDKKVFKIDESKCTTTPDMIGISNTHVDLRSIDPDDDEHIDRVFNTFIRKYDKEYEHVKEHLLRKAIFQKNLRNVIEKNRQNLGYKLTINHFSDRTEKELKYFKGLLPRDYNDRGTIPFPYTDDALERVVKTLPDEYDLRVLGAVSPVKSQESCGSCWTFGTTAAVEGALSLRNGGRLIRLSNQALLDCAWGFGNLGCEGGFDSAAYRWIMAHGLPTEEEYGPYLNMNGYCHIANMTKTYKIRGYTNVTTNNVEALKVALVNHGPVSVSIDASDDFMQYSSGIFYDSTCNPTKLSHEVTLVGYGQQSGDEYWILKNSWGPEWGVEGYIYISTRDNNCGVTTEPTYPVF